MVISRSLGRCLRSAVSEPFFVLEGLFDFSCEECVAENAFDYDVAVCCVVVLVTTAFCLRWWLFFVLVV